ncbi:peptidoglycan recognition family protein [Clostridium sp. HCS.1]|uniref:peptidoglycan recognition protein family protein n=1 Tax=Clostridium sp. HCS.1 TaxID=3238594 RepID=UPI003A0FEDD4
MIIIIRVKKVYIYILLFLVLIFSLAIFFKDSIREYFKISYRKYYNIHISTAEINEMEKSLNIMKVDYNWKENLNMNNKPNKIIIHHTALAKASPEEINEFHKSKGWKGIGYNFYISKNGTIYEGRPEGSEGAHTLGENSSSIGICLEGNFEDEEVKEAQLKNLINLSLYISLKYDIYKIIGHKEVYSTLCPGEKFPLEEVRKMIVKNIKKYKRLEIKLGAV